MITRGTKTVMLIFFTLVTQEHTGTSTVGMHTLTHTIITRTVKLKHPNEITISAVSKSQFVLLPAQMHNFLPS